MDKEKSDLLQGTLEVLILKIVALESIHGYGIAQRIRQISKSVLQVQQGSLYPALHRLEKRGLLRAEWGEAETGREAKFYSLTRAGRKQLEAETAKWNRLSEAVTLILRTAEWEEKCGFESALRSLN
jgi:PadR family transcriptional regulator PadR